MDTLINLINLIFSKYIYLFFSLSEYLEYKKSHTKFQDKYSYCVFMFEMY